MESSYSKQTEEQKQKARDRRKRYYERNRSKVIEHQKLYDSSHKAQRNEREQKRMSDEPAYRKARLDDLRTRGERYRQECSAYIEEYKAQHPCACGEADPDCLSFHHLRDKKFTVASAAKGRCALATLIKEIEKCVVLCCNCHMKLHRRLERESKAPHP